MGVAERIPEQDRGLSIRAAALAFARAAHAGQLRGSDGAPFIAHPREVAALLDWVGAPQHIVAAGALHDVIEKTPTRASDVRRRFGVRVTRLVLAVTEDERIASYTRRKAALRRQVAAAGEEALMLLAADKVSKARELRIEGERGSAAGDVRRRHMRLAHYERCLQLLQQRLPASPLVGQLRTELEIVRSQPQPSRVPGEGPLSGLGHSERERACEHRVAAQL